MLLIKRKMCFLKLIFYDFLSKETNVNRQFYYVSCLPFAKNATKSILFYCYWIYQLIVWKNFGFMGSCDCIIWILSKILLCERKIYGNWALRQWIKKLIVLLTEFQTFFRIMELLIFMLTCSSLFNCHYIEKERRG